MYSYYNSCNISLKFKLLMKILFLRIRITIYYIIYLCIMLCYKLVRENGDESIMLLSRVNNITCTFYSYEKYDLLVDI